MLELGCGWGSLCLWIAEKYPTCRVLAVSNSRTQREYILARCDEMALKNVEVAHYLFGKHRMPGSGLLVDRFHT